MKKKAVKKIDNKTQALSALRKAGWEKSTLQLTRGAMTYRLAGVERSPFITLSDHAFIITCAGKWVAMSALLHIGNTKASASAEVLRQIDELRARELLGDEVGVFDLAVALGKAIAEDHAARLA